MKKRLLFNIIDYHVFKMKLNIGCGGDYKKGYINIDAFDSSVADQIMSAYDLKFEGNSIDEIYASQLIEHLGIIGAINFFSECFRVLKPNAKLIIETPDIRKSFEIFLQGNREARKYVLPWIYGVDIKGMMHRFCFPDDLLEEILPEIGFVNIKKDFFEIEKCQPNLKISCIKVEDYQGFHLMACFRKKLLQKNIIDIDDQIVSLEKHDLTVFFTKKINKFIKTQDENILKDIFFNGAIKNPMITHVFFEEIKLQKLYEEQLTDKYLEILDILIEKDYPNILVNMLKKTEGYIGQQEQLFSIISDMGIKTVEKLLDSQQNNDILRNLEETLKNINPEEKIQILTPKLIMLKAHHFYQLAIKEYIINNYQKAIDLLQISSGLYRNEILYYCNLGRLYNLENKTDMANSYYEKALKLTDIFDYEKPEIKQIIEKEKNNLSIKHNTPVTSLNEIFC